MVYGQFNPEADKVPEHLPEAYLITSFFILTGIH